MKKIVVLFLMMFVLTGCMQSVPPGQVGVKVYLYGGDKGVDSQVLGVGRYWIGMNEDLYLFPTFTQNQVWTRDRTEGSPNDDSFTFQTKEGLNVNTDVGISYHINADKIDTIFQKYRKGIHEITDTVLRSSVRDAFNKASSTKDIESIYGSGKASLMDEVTEIVRGQMGSVGIEVENLYLVGNMRLPETVVESINRKIQATQMTQQRENEVAQSKAEAQKAIEAARGEAESKLALARAEAESIEIKGEALRANPNVIELTKIERWDGVLPQYMTGSVPFININK